MRDDRHYKRFTLPATKSPIDHRTVASYVLEWTYYEDDAAKSGSIVELEIGGRHAELNTQQTRILCQILMHVIGDNGNRKRIRLPIEPSEGR